MKTFFEIFKVFLSLKFQEIGDLFIIFGRFFKSRNFLILLGIYAICFVVGFSVTQCPLEYQDKIMWFLDTKPSVLAAERSQAAQEIQEISFYLYIPIILLAYPFIGFTVLGVSIVVPILLILLVIFILYAIYRWLSWNWYLAKKIVEQKLNDG